ncbi:reverse transcriptase [Gossypium australe]|uniref:Reverse transcriptase n=1 Tax=Gossypium australe TaxID=47621 RepID=A0A5B6WRB7_9ROSI|nr:reverse transcriptase [Gossypium australe]
MVPSIIKPPILELKPPSNHLKYGYLGEQNTLIKKEKDVVDAQQRLNRAMKEVVKKELLKWLDAGIVHVIFEIEWVSLTQCVPKKGWLIIPIHPNDEEKKTTFTCPFGTYAFKRMPFGLCNDRTTFMRCMSAFFVDMLEKGLDVFMDDFSVYGDSF